MHVLLVFGHASVGGEASGVNVSSLIVFQSNQSSPIWLVLLASLLWGSPVSAL